MTMKLDETLTIDRPKRVNGEACDASDCITRSCGISRYVCSI